MIDLVRLVVAVALAARMDEASVARRGVATTARADTIALVVGASTVLRAAWQDGSAQALEGPRITWVSGAPTVAEASPAGRVTAIAPGTTTVFATRGASGASGASGSVVATVAIVVRDGGVAGPSGATITTRDRSVSLAVPPGALDVQRTVTIEPAAPAPADAHVIPATAVALGPTALTLAPAATLTLRFDPSLLPRGGRAGKLRLARATGSGWQPVATTIDIVESTARASISTLGTYALLAPEPIAPEPPTSTLRAAAEARGLSLGAAVDGDALANDAAYRRALAAEFNALTPEKALKFGPVHPERDRFDFTTADEIVAFARANRMVVHGHTLVWHLELPAWLTAGKLSRAEMLAILKDHINTVVGRYRGTIESWDVVNEALSDDGSALRRSVWLQSIGPDYVDSAFVWAHRADPEARLYYNDFDGEATGAKADAIYDLVRSLQHRGIPVHGVGLQLHISTESYPPPDDVAANIRRLAALGLAVRISEMDVRIPEPAVDYDVKTAHQARIYADMLRAVLEASPSVAITLWGVTDKYSWVPYFFAGEGSALLLDEALRAKPAYRAVREALSGER